MPPIELKTIDPMDLVRAIANVTRDVYGRDCGNFVQEVGEQHIRRMSPAWWFYDPERSNSPWGISADQSDAPAFIKPDGQCRVWGLRSECDAKRSGLIEAIRKAGPDATTS